MYPPPDLFSRHLVSVIVDPDENRTLSDLQAGVELMKYIVLIVGVALMFDANAMAQEEAAVGTVTSPEAAAEPAPSEAQPADAPPKEEKKRSPYYKKVQGWLWIEGFAGPSAYDPDKFGSLDFGGASADAPKVNGPEYGFAVLLGLGGFEIGVFYRQANYSAYKLMKVGVDMQGIFRFIPYVHPMVRIDLFYSRTFSGNPFGLTDPNVDGGGFTLGAGLRIPIIRWMSFAATFDWSMIGLAVRTPTENSGVLGQQLGATFALTFHFIGVRGGD